MIIGCTVALALSIVAIVQLTEPTATPLVAQIQHPPTGFKLRPGERSSVRIRVGGGTTNSVRWELSLQRSSTADAEVIGVGEGGVGDEAVAELVADDLVTGESYALLLTASDGHSVSRAKAEILLADPQYSLIPLEEGNLGQLRAGIYGIDTRGTRLLYAGPPADPMQLLLLDRTSGRREVLRLRVGSTEGARLSGDGSRLFYYGIFPPPAGPPPQGDLALGFLDLGTTGLFIIDRDASAFFSTDARGRRVAFQGIAANTMQYFLYDEASGAHRQLTDDPDAIRRFGRIGSTDCPQILGTRPFISADGSTVVIITSATLGLAPPDEAVGCRVFAYDVEGNQWRQVAALPRELVVDVPALSADGRWLSFTVRSRPPRFAPVAVLLNVETGELHDPAVDVGLFVTFDAVVTGDGQGLVISSQADLDPRVGNADRNLELFYYDLAARTFTQITETVGGIGTTPGGCPSYRPFVNRDGGVATFYFVSPPIERCQLDGPMRHERDGFMFRFVRALRVRPGNRGPVFERPPDQRVAAGDTLTLSFTATDPDGDPISFFAQVKDGTDVPPGSEITDHHDGTATFHWPTRPENAGEWVLRVAAFDEGGGEVFHDVTISVVGQGPPLATATPTARSTFSATATLSPTLLPPVAEPCPGDCDGNREVGVDELVVGTQIVLGKTSMHVCPAAACRDMEAVTIDCLLRAVNAALEGCP
jgi:hypothetical protein